MNNDLYFEIFAKRECHYQWEKHIEYATRCNYGTDEYRNDWVEALEFCRKELGKSFLKSCGRNHPLLNLVESKGHWQTDELISLVTLLSQLRNTESGYKKLKAKLISETACRAEGKPFIEVLQMLSKAGFKCSVLEEIKTVKTPDIEISNPETKESIFVEVSQLGDGESREMIQENYSRFLRVLEPPAAYMPYSFAQLRYLDESEMTKSLSVVMDCREKAMEEEAIVYYQDEMIRFAVCHNNKYAELMEWIEKNDYRKGPMGAPLNFDDTHRLCNNKLDKKAKQIPPNSSGIVYIPVNSIYFMVFDIENAVRLFTSKMIKYPNLFGVVMYATVIDGAEEISEKSDVHFLGVKKSNKAVSRYLFFVRNLHFSRPISDNTSEKIYHSFCS